MPSTHSPAGAVSSALSESWITLNDRQHAIARLLFVLTVLFLISWPTAILAQGKRGIKATIICLPCHAGDPWRGPTQCRVLCFMSQRPPTPDEEKHGPGRKHRSRNSLPISGYQFAAKGHRAPRAIESEVMREFKTHHFRFGQVTSFDSVKIIRNGEPILIVVHQDRGAKCLLSCGFLESNIADPVSYNGEPSRSR